MRLLASSTALLNLNPLPNASCHTRCPLTTPAVLSMYASSYQMLQQWSEIQQQQQQQQQQRLSTLSISLQTVLQQVLVAAVLTMHMPRDAPAHQSVTQITETQRLIQHFFIFSKSRM
jgi:DNA-binding transcriptional LysR family regulator